MVKVTIELSEQEICMLMNCIDSALDTKHMPEASEVRAKEIKEQLNKYL